MPHELKDEKYWVRRRKNNQAAKRSRDARRVKENQIALRASYLEKEVCISLIITLNCRAPTSFERGDMITIFHFFENGDGVVQLNLDLYIVAKF